MNVILSTYTEDEIVPIRASHLDFQVTSDLPNQLVYPNKGVRIPPARSWNLFRNRKKMHINFK